MHLGSKVFLWDVWDVLGMLQRKLPMASCQAINIMKKGYTGQVEDFLFWHVGCDCIFIMYI